MNAFIPPPLPSAQPKTAALAIWSLVLGIIGVFLSLMCLGIVAAIPAVICGHQALSRIKQSGGELAGQGLAIGGLVTGYLGIGLTILLIPLMMVIAVPNFIKARAASQKNACLNNLRQIDAAKNEWALEHHKKSTDTPTETDLLPYLANHQWPRCPADGSYTIGPVGTLPFCSLPKHQLTETDSAEAGAGQALKAPAGLVAWWQAENNAQDGAGNNPGQLMNQASYRPGKVGTAFNLDGNNGFVLVQASASLNVGSEEGFTMEGWILPEYLNSGVTIFEYERQLATRNGADVGVQLVISDIPNQGPHPGALAANIVDDNQDSHIMGSADGVLTAGVWQHVALTYDRASGMAALYKDGEVVKQAHLGSFTPQTSFPNLLLGARTTYNSVAHPGGVFSGGMDEISFYDRALSAAEIASIFAAGDRGKQGPIRR